MNVSDAVKARRTIRGYKTDSVPQETIQEILNIARHAPSNSNIQPSHIAIFSADAKEKLRAAILAEFDEGKPPYPTWPSGGVGLHGIYKERRRACGFGYYDTMGVSRENKPGQRALLRKNWEFFGAPHVAFFSMPDTMHRANAVDMGIMLQTLMLLMTERGISCIPQGALASYPGPVYEMADIPEGNAILFGLSFGYADEDAQINQVIMDREPAENFSQLLA
ncbi:MAG: nitroreductase [Pseudomonadota bacterium]